MGYRYDDLSPGEVYHVFSRGVEKRKIFLDDTDRERGRALLVHSMPVGVIQSYSLAARQSLRSLRTEHGKGLIDLLGYCLMDNHLHCLLRENVEGGISLYMHRLLTSYSKYFNTRYDRSGSLFIHPFKAVLVEQDEQLLQVIRYIHLNPYVAHMINDPFAYRWSSLEEYMTEPRCQRSICHRQLISGMMGVAQHKEFIQDKVDYERSLAFMGYQLVDYDD